MPGMTIMSLSLLLLAVVSAALAWNLDHPVYRSRVWHAVSFLFGWLTGELAPFVIAAGVLAALLVLASHGEATLPDAFSLALLVGSWGVMLHHYIAGGDAAQVMEDALRKALGPDYQSRVRQDLVALFPRAVLPRTLARPFRLDLPEVTRVRDVVYGEEGGQRLLLDVYHRNDMPANCPVLFQLHGGGWTERMGSKNEQARPLMNHMAARGWVCVSVDYRLSPSASFPAHIIDCKRALAWVRSHITRWGGDPSFVVATGGSAGGHLCSLLALSANDPQWQPGFEDADTRVQGCIPFYGVYDLSGRHGLKPNGALLEVLESWVIKKRYHEATEVYEQGSPLERVHAGAPPFLIIHGDRDGLCPVAEAQLFAQRLAAVSESPVAYAEIPGAQHAFDIFRSLRSELVMYGVERFLAYLQSTVRSDRS
jgi:acetyl esterase/lipase